VTDIVLGVAASHSTLMNTHWHLVEHHDRAERFRDGLATAKACLEAARPDAIVVIGSNHFRGFWLDLMPAFTIGVDTCAAAGDGGTLAGDLPVDTELARHVCQSLIDADFDVAFSARLSVDHGIAQALQYLSPAAEIPIVPIIVNVFAPPLPSLRRCHAFGSALRAALASFPDSRRVAVIGSGGLSHQLPWPDWRHPETDDEQFLVSAFADGRERWRDFEVRRREIILGGAPHINETFDRDLLGRIASRDGLGDVLRMTSEELAAVAGNGGQEIRTWIITIAAMGDVPGRTLVYEPMPEWLTGMGVAVFDATIQPA
jgi:2,3-dihydroxyphenylpropionate 1,2-dioxygenase